MKTPHKRKPRRTGCGLKIKITVNDYSYFKSEENKRINKWLKLEGKILKADYEIQKEKHLKKVQSSKGKVVKVVQTEKPPC